MSLTPTPDFSQLSASAKSFWSTKEGKFSAKAVMVMGGGILLVGFWFREVIENFFQFIFSLARNGVMLGVILVVLAIVTSPIWNADVRSLCWNAFQIIMGDAYDILIRKDPIKILRNNSLLLRQQLQIIDEATKGLAGSKARQEKDLQNELNNISEQKRLASSAQRQMEDFMRQAQNAKNMNDRQEALLAVDRCKLAIAGCRESAGYSVEAIRSGKGDLEATSNFYEKMSRIRNLAEFKIRSMDQKADVYQKRHDSAKKTQAAMGAASRVFKGDPRQQALVNRTIDILNQEQADTAGAMSDFSSWASRFIADQDMRNGMVGEEADKVFAQIEAKLALPGMTESVATSTSVNEALQIPDLLADFPDPSAPIALPVPTQTKKN